jgi:signal transduction histidine kinase
MRTLLNDLLDFSRLESNQLKLSPSKYMLDVQLAETIQDLEMKAHEKDININFQQPDGHIEVFSDHERIKQVIANLISNSIKFTPEGGKIDVTCESDGKTVEFSVSDTGVGIPLDKQSKIFEKFYQVDTSSSRTHGGFGIGLSICKSVVEKHGGEILVSSLPGNGATFTVKLPVQITSAACADERGT